MSAITIRDTFPFAKWEKMSNFLKDAYGSSCVMRNRALFEWQFLHLRKQKQATVLCAYAHEKLVGILGYIPTRLLWGPGTREVIGAWMANWSVLPEFRVGIGWMLIRRLQEMFPIVLGQGANALNRQLVSKLGFAFYESIPRYVAVFSLGRVLEMFEPEQRSFYQVRLARVQWKVFAHAKGEVCAIQSAALSEDQFDPDWSVYPALQFGTLRDADYIMYRYLNHPIFKYEMRMSGSAQRPAVCVFRIETTNGIATVKVGRILEWFFPETDEGRKCGVAVLASALEEMKNHGCLFADFYCSSGLHREMVESAGMHLAEDDLLPSRLSPIQHVSRPQNMELWSAPELGALPNLYQCYVTKSDGDQDRPNIPYVE